MTFHPTGARAVPPGRAGRMWLRRRLASAARGREQLDRKLRVLLPEQRRFRTHADRCRDDWERAYAQARLWLGRAALLSGQDGIRHAIPASPLSFEIAWSTVMGLRIPSEVVPSPQRDERALPADNAAIMPAREAYRAALIAGIRFAAAAEAVRRLDDETATTRRRLRALDRRWLPWLTDSLHAVELALDEAEQEDGSRLRRALDAQRRHHP